MHSGKIPSPTTHLDVPQNSTEKPTRRVNEPLQFRASRRGKNRSQGHFPQSLLDAEPHLVLTVATIRDPFEKKRGLP